MGYLRFAGHICHMDPLSLTFRIFHYKLIRNRTRDRPILRWADCVEDDFKVLRVTDWKTVAKQEIRMEESSGEGLGPPRAVVSIEE
ncbi:hypothetical protein TNCV_4189721 [Trichonephila clavipes]|nr:hypothetical protein TNCV_4189721 [Trichonephila clavipes]